MDYRYLVQKKLGTVTVAVHAGRDVSLRTVRSILAQAGLTEEEFKELL